MDRTEIIERLKNIAEHAVHTVDERAFIMSLDDGIAVHEAIELLTNCPEIPDSCNAETVEAIPVEWIELHISALEFIGKKESVRRAEAIRNMLGIWRYEQKGN